MAGWQADLTADVNLAIQADFHRKIQSIMDIDPIMIFAFLRLTNELKQIRAQAEAVRLVRPGLASVGTLEISVSRISFRA